jgi:hypothetical protein
MQALKATLTVVSFAAFLAGCGGGSDGTTATPVANDAAVAQAQSNGNLGNPGVVPPQSQPAGKTYSEWSALWWQWAVKRPSGQGPLDGPPNDPAFCALDQSGNVWFLGTSSFGQPPAQPRQCNIPAGKFIFFPLEDAEWSENEALYSNFVTPGTYCPVSTSPQNATLPALLACAGALLGTLGSPPVLMAELDGRQLINLEAYRFQAVDPNVTLSPNPTNLIGIPVPGTPVTPAVPANFPSSGIQFGADGYFIMLAPLSTGTHTLTFQGGPFYGKFTLVVGG